MAEADEAVASFANSRHVRQSKRRNRRVRWLMGSLGVLAVLLIATGIAAPQVMYWYDSDRYETLVSDLADLDAQLAQTEIDTEAAQMLLFKQQEEVQALLPRLQRLGAADQSVIPAAATAEVRTVSKTLEEHLQETKTRAHSAPSEAATKLLSTRLKNREIGTPVSWFEVDVPQMRDLMEITERRTAASEETGTVTREMIDQVRSQTREAQIELREANVRLASYTRGSEQLADSLHETVKAVDAAALASPQQAAVLAAQIPDAAPERDVMTANAAAAARAAGATALIENADGSVVLVAAEAAALPEGATEVHLARESSRLNLLLNRLSAYRTAAVAAVAAQAAYAEAMAAAAAAAEEEENDYYEGSDTGDTGGGGTEEPLPPTDPPLPPVDPLPTDPPGETGAG